MELAVQYLYEAKNMIEEYEADTFGVFLESEKEDGMLTKIKTKLLAAVKKIREMLGKLMSDINGMFSKIFNGKGKEQLEKVQEIIKNNPEAAKLEVEIEDVNKINSAYEKAISVAQKAAKSGLDFAESKNIKNDLERILKATAITVGIGAAANMVSHNKKFASYAHKELKKQDGWGGVIEKVIGKENKKSLQKEMKKRSGEVQWFGFVSNLMAQRNKKTKDSLFTTLTLIVKTATGVATNDEKGRAIQGVGRFNRTKVGSTIIGGATQAIGTGVRIGDKITQGKQFMADRKASKSTKAK